MKKYINLAFGYALAGIACGVFYREFTKYNGFDGRTTLAFMHLHLFALGMLMFLLVALFAALTNVETQKTFRSFLVLYNISLPFMVLMLGVRGVLQVLGTPLSAGASAAISGIAGLAHILFTAALVLLFLALRRCSLKKN